MRPSDSLVPIGLGSGRPLPLAYLAAGACSLRDRAGPATARARPRARTVRGDGLPAPRSSGLSWGETRVSQVPGSSSSCAPRTHTPPVLRALAFASASSSSSRTTIPWTSGILHFRGWLAAAHWLARLRIAGIVASAAARLATDVDGYSFIARDFAPAGRPSPNFVATACCHSFRTSLAWSHRDRDRDRALPA